MPLLKRHRDDLKQATVWFPDSGRMAAFKTHFVLKRKTLEETRLKWVLHRALFDPLIVSPPGKRRKIKQSIQLLSYFNPRGKNSGFSLTNFGPPDDSTTGDFATSESKLKLNLELIHFTVWKDIIPN